jgi:prepilin-type processing-associated H-X9-DG protein
MVRGGVRMQSENLASGSGSTATSAMLDMETVDAANDSNLNSTAYTSGGAPSSDTADGVFKSVRFCLGPLTLRNIDAAPVTASTIPMLADASLSDPTDSILPCDISKSPATGTYNFSLANGTAESVTVAVQDPSSALTAPGGQNAAESFQDGPGYYDATNNRISLIGGATDLTAELACEAAGNCASATGPTGPSGNGGNGEYLQDTRDYGCVHGGGANLSCNILFADGSVVEFFDVNGDHYLNPGFVVNPGNSTALAASTAASFGYKDNTVDLPPAQCFSGMFLLSNTNDKPKSFKY